MVCCLQSTAFITRKKTKKLCSNKCRLSTFNVQRSTFRVQLYMENTQGKKINGIGKGETGTKKDNANANANDKETVKENDRASHTRKRQLHARSVYFITYLKYRVHKYFYIIDTEESLDWLDLSLALASVLDVLLLGLRIDKYAASQPVSMYRILYTPVFFFFSLLLGT